MAKLTTIGGTDVYFVAGAVSAVADFDADANRAATSVYGITPSPVSVAEAAAGFLGRIGVAKSFVRFTRPHSFSIWINARSVSSVQAASGLGYAREAHTVVSA